jgi:2-oxoglutarate ferredoxin oxidoreductase subunit alpha
MQTATETGKRSLHSLKTVVIRFAGDSGDGMQLTGNQFTTSSAIAGNDLATLPDFPAEIRAPAGTLPGVSGFQLNFAAVDIFTPGDRPDVLVAMNPAALKVNVDDLKPNGILIVNTDSFDAKDLRKAGYEQNPLDDGSLDGYRLFKVALTSLTRKSVADLELPTRVADRCKNFFALGMMYWLFSRSMDVTLKWIAQRFKGSPALLEANTRALRAGYAYCAATEAFQHQYEVPPAPLQPGIYRNINGNSALALGLVAASRRAGIPLFLGGYPITPASEILHELARYKHFGVYTFQAEDEIAGICSSLGASFGGALGVTATSGPGVALKSETIGLATMVELPLVICNIQRGGPSTGLPTKTEQADLLQAMFGRNSEAPLPVLAAATPADCFNVAFEAARIAIKHTVPVILLSDGYLANGAEPWKVPKAADLPEVPVHFHTEVEGFRPYMRNPETLARPWVRPGTPGLEHRVGGLEKDDDTGNVSYEPLNHEHMIRLRAEKVERVARELPPVEVLGSAEGGELLLVGWGSTYGAITGAVRRLRAEGADVSAVHLRHLNPLQSDLGDVLRRFRRVAVVELNMGQLLWVLRARYLIDMVGINKVQGRPFIESEIMEQARALLKEQS